MQKRLNLEYLKVFAIPHGAISVSRLHACATDTLNSCGPFKFDFGRAAVIRNSESVESTGTAGMIATGDNSS